MKPINRQKLVDVLTAVKPGLAKKEIDETATHFVFTEYDIATHNDQICIAHPLPFKTDFICSVPADALYKIVSGINSEEITLELKDGKLKIQGGKTKASLATTDAVKALAKIDSLDLDNVFDKMIPLPEDFILGATLCMFSASKDMTHPVLTCLLIEDEFIMSSDDLRISKYEMKSAMDCSILIPASAIMELIKLPVTSYYISPSWVYFATKDDVVFCCRPIAGEYNDYSQYFKNFKGVSFELPAGLSDMVTAASVLVNDQYDTDKLVEIEIEKGILCCKGESEIGKIEVEADMKLKDFDKIKFSINPQFLTAVLTHTGKMTYCKDRALFDAGNFQHLMALKVD